MSLVTVLVLLALGGAFWALGATAGWTSRTVLHPLIGARVLSRDRRRLYAAAQHPTERSALVLAEGLAHAGRHDEAAVWTDAVRASIAGGDHALDPDAIAAAFATLPPLDDDDPA